MRFRAPRAEQRFRRHSNCSMLTSDGESAKYAAARQAGDFEIAAMIAREGAGLIHDVPPAREIIEHIVQQASTLVSWLSSQAAFAWFTSRNAVLHLEHRQLLALSWLAIGGFKARLPAATRDAL
jgi:hypothetical protein